MPMTLIVKLDTEQYYFTITIKTYTYVVHFVHSEEQNLNVYYLKKLVACKRV